MLLTLANVVSPEDCAALVERARGLEWRDGARTAGAVAKAVKRNEQANLHTPEGQIIHRTLLEAIEAHPVLEAAARPRRFSRLMISRTGPGGGYGLHVDNALMGRGPARIRTDLSFTLFLSPLEDYDGGALAIDGAGGRQTLRLAPGDLVLYPSTDLHEVEPVTRGERIVCVGWIESLVPDAAQRAILFDLENLRAELRRSLPATSPATLTLDKSIANLLRLWARP